MLKGRYACADRYGNAKLLLAVLASLATSGCAFRTQTAGMAMDHNEFVADTTNGQTVLNILRAREREPMHFTSFAKVAGNVTATGGVTTNLAANGNGGTTQLTTTTATKSGPGNALIDQTVTVQELAGTALGATNITPQFSLQVNTGTSFDIAINANDEFYKGILGTLPNSLLVHYLRQGFPPDLLSHLTIGKLEFYAEVHDAKSAVQDSKSLVHRELLMDITNTPDEPEKIVAFAAAMKCRHLSYVADKEKPKSLPLSGPEALSSVAPELIGRLRNVSASGPYAYETPRAEYKIALSAPINSGLVTAACESLGLDLRAKFRDYAAKLADADLKDFLQKNQSTSAPPGSEKFSIYDEQGGGRRPGRQYGILATTSPDLEAYDQIPFADRATLHGHGGATFEFVDFFDQQLKGAYKGNLVIEISFRSIEGVLYYLGEYARNADPTPKLKSATCPSNESYCLPIIRIAPASDVEPDRRWVTVDYRGQRYAVPISGAKLDSEGGRSSQTISLVQQLLNLTKTAKELPSTPSVRIVN